MSSSRPAPPQYPTTATLMLLAQPGDPFAQASARAQAAHQAINELLELLPAEQQQLAQQFYPAQRATWHAASVLRTWTLSVQESAVLASTAVPSWGEAPMLEDVWVGRQPVRLADEAVYGFEGAISPLLAHLTNAVDALAQGQATYGIGLRRVMLAAAVAEFAARTESAVSMFTAAVWDFERPAVPAPAGSSARVELRSSPRAHPQARWARAARLVFVPGRVELITAEATDVIGADRPIAALVHVVPPSPRAALSGYDVAERYAQLPLQDELGAVHLCDAEGYSLGAIAVADWLNQPWLQVGQQVATTPGEHPQLARDRLVWGLQAAGIVDGAAVLGVPVRRGVMHPPVHPALTSTLRAAGPAPPGTPGYQPRELVRLLRPGPHHQAYRGGATKPAAAYKRRLQRMKFWRKDTGPASPINFVVRSVAPATIWIGGLGSAYLFSGTLWVQLCLLWSAVAVSEPWLWWAWVQLRDRGRQPMTAVYRPGRYRGGTRGFASRAALLFDGTDIGVRGPRGHLAWAAGPWDPHLGIVAVHRLVDGAHPWAVALVDQGGRWQFVLPVEQWAPGGDLSALAGFAEAAGLTVADAQAEQLEGGEDVFDDRTPQAQRVHTGPPTRGMVILMFWCLTVVPFTLAGNPMATLALLVLAAVAVVPAAARSLWHRLLARRS